MLQKARKKNLSILKNTEKSRKKVEIKSNWAFFLFGVLYPLLLFWVKQTSVGIGLNIDFSHLLFFTFLYAMYFEYSITFYAIFDEFPIRCNNKTENKTAALLEKIEDQKYFENISWSI